MIFPYAPLLPVRQPGYVELEPAYQPRASQATTNFCTVFIRCCAAILGIGMLVCLFVWRYAYHDPELEDNVMMILYSAIVLFMIGFSFIITHED